MKEDLCVTCLNQIRCGKSQFKNKDCDAYEPMVDESEFMMNEDYKLM